MKRIFILLTNWEYYPWQIVYLPVYFYYLFNVIRSGRFFYFSNVNTSLKNAGFFGNTKMEMYATLPKNSYPNTLFIEEGSDLQKVEALLFESRISYPAIIKPNIGERGEGLEYLENRSDLRSYLKTQAADCIIQPFVAYNFECSIFCYRLNIEDQMTISSLVGKEFLQVKGDGLKTIEQLIDQSERAYLQKEKLRKNWETSFGTIPKLNELIILRQNANHSKGAKFYPLASEVDDDLESVVNDWCKDMKGFQYGRFDIRCESTSALKQLKSFKIIELNGIGAEPIDMYITGTSVLQSWKILLKHWQIMYLISSNNRKKGLLGQSDRSGWKALFRYWQFKQAQ